MAAATGRNRHDARHRQDHRHQLELDGNLYRMHTPAGFTKDMQFAVEVLKEHDAPGGAGQIVRGVHMRLHAGSHVDAPEHMVKGGSSSRTWRSRPSRATRVVADLRHRVPGGAHHRRGSRRGGRRHHRARRPAAAAHRLQQGLFRAAIGAGARPISRATRCSGVSTRAWCWSGSTSITATTNPIRTSSSTPRARSARTASSPCPISTISIAITAPRFTLMALPLKMIGVEASPVRAVVIEG